LNLFFIANFETWFVLRWRASVVDAPLQNFVEGAFRRDLPSEGIFAIPIWLAWHPPFEVGRVPSAQLMVE